MKIQPKEEQDFRTHPQLPTLQCDHSLVYKNSQSFEAVKHAVSELTDEQRVELFSGYCTECGAAGALCDCGDRFPDPEGIDS